MIRNQPIALELVVELRQGMFRAVLKTVLFVIVPNLNRHQELPIITPQRNTRTPPRATCIAAENHGVSMYRCRIQLIIASSTTTTITASVVAARKSEIRYGSV